jgi:uncharacterized membrane protein YqhA
MDVNLFMQQLLRIWQSLATLGAWYQDAFLALVCVVAVVMLFLTGTVIGLFLQSLWGIFITSHQTEAEH